MRCSLALLATAALAEAAPQWGQNGGGRLRAGVWPATALANNVGELRSAAAPLLEAGAATAAAPFNAPLPLQLSQGSPYPITTPTVRGCAPS
jgi:hypothetical protein